MERFITVLHALKVSEMQMTFKMKLMRAKRIGISQFQMQKIIVMVVLLMTKIFVKKPLQMLTPGQKKVFIKYNTPIPSSAGVERLFSVGKDILKPNRCALKDGNFEKLLFLHEKKC